MACGNIIKNLSLYVYYELCCKYIIHGEKINSIITIVITFSWLGYCNYLNLLKYEEFIENYYTFEKMKYFIEKYCVIFDRYEIAKKILHNKRLAYSPQIDDYCIFDLCFYDDKFDFNRANLIMDNIESTKNKEWEKHKKWGVCAEHYKDMQLFYKKSKVEPVYKSEELNYLPSDDELNPKTKKYYRNLKKGLKFKYLDFTNDRKNNTLYQIKVLIGLGVTLFLLKLID